MAASRRRRRLDTRRSRWSQRVTLHSDALDLDSGVFTRDDPLAIAKSLKHSAEASRRRKTSPFRSAMSMLNFYINRAGKQLPADQLARLETAKDELRGLFGRPRHDSRARSSKSAHRRHATS